MSPDRKLPLERLLAEVRAQHPPEPRDAVLPERLRAEFHSFVEQPRSAARRKRNAGWQLGGAVALAAAALLALYAAVPERAVPGLASAALVDGAPLAPGSPIEAGTAPRSVQHPERASWRLQPGSRARLLSGGPVLRVDLEHGRLTAVVRPSPQPETFVVQARGTEVAVHGTRFSVSVQGEHVHVEVEEGSVQVRPIGQSAGTLLRPGMQADFLGGALQPAPAPPAGVTPPPAPTARPPQPAALATPPQPGPAQPHAERSPAPPAPVASAEPATPELPAPPPDASSQQTLELVTERVRACFRRHLPGSSELGIEVSTRLGLWVEPSGQLLRAEFDPPLAPAIESCVARELGQFRAAPSPEGYRVQRNLQLQR
jgi:hypothetical protein